MTDVARLAIVFSADTSALDKGFARAKKQVSDFQKAAGKESVKLDADSSGLTKSLDSSTKSLGAFHKEANKKVDVDVDRNGAAAAHLQALSGGFGELSSNIRQFKTIAAATTLVPGIIAGLGALPAAATAAAGAVGQLSIALGQGLAGAAAIGGTALIGAQVGLRAYSAVLSRTIEDSRTAFAATHENAMKQLEMQRNTILNTQASKDFNNQLNETILGLTHVEAEIGNRVFPVFTKELQAWSDQMDVIGPKVVETSGTLATLAAGFSQWIRTAQDGRLIGDIFDFINGSAVRAASTLSALGIAGALVFQQLIPPASRLQKDVVKLALAVSGFVSSSQGIKTIGGIVDTLEHRFYQLRNTVRDFGLGLAGVFIALNEQGGPDRLMAGLENLAAGFRRVMSSSGAGRQAIINFMDSAQPTLNQLWKLTKTVVTQFGLLASNVNKAGQAGGKMGTLASVIAGVRKSIEPLRELFQNTFIALGPVLARLIPEAADFLSVFLGSSGPLKAFLNTVTSVLHLINGLPAPIKSAIVNLIALKTIMGSFGLTAFIGGLGRVATQMYTLRTASNAAKESQLALAAAQGKTAASSGASAAASGAAASRFGKLGTIVRGAGTAFLTLGRFLLGPWGLAIAGVVTGAVLIYRNWGRITKVLKPVTDGFRSFWNLVRPVAAALGGAIVSSIKSFARGLLSAIVPGKKLGAQVHVLADNLGDFARHAAPVVTAAIKSFTRWLKNSQPTIRAVGATVGTLLAQAFDGAVKAVRLAITAFRGAGRALAWLAKTSRSAAEATRQAITSAWNGIKKGVSSAVKYVVNNVKDGWNNAKKNTQMIWNGIKGVIGSAWNAIKKLVTGALNNLKKVISGAWNAIKSTTSKAWEAVKNTIGDKITAAKNTATDVVGKLKSSLSSAWDSIKSTASSAWEAVKNSVVNPMQAAKDKVVSLWNQLEDFVSGVLNRLGIGTGGASGGSSSSAPGPKMTPNTSSGQPGLQPKNMASGGIVHQPAVGGFADGGTPHAVYGEVGKREYYIVPERQDNVKYLRGAANEMGFGLVKFARGGILDAWKKAGVPFNALGATLPVSALSPAQQEAARAVHEKFPSTTQNTYVGHPGGQANSFDNWGPGGRGDPIGSVGDQVKPFLIKNFSPYDWLIWKGIYTTPGGSKPYWDPGDMHFDHVHFTRGSSGGGFLGGPTTIPNPKQALFELLWKPIQALADRAIAPLKNARFVMTQAAGGLADKAVTKIHDWIDEKIPDTIGAPSGTGTAGLGGSDAVGGDAAANRAMGEKMLAASNVSGSWSALNSLWTRESGWNRFAKNPSSGAYGIPQALPESKLPPSGQSSGGSHAGAQIDWGLGYIGSRYGSTDAAWQHSQNTGWYERGGVVPGKSGKPVPIVAHAGEAVIPAHVVKAYARGFARGGISGAPTSGWNLIGGDGTLGIGGPAADAARQAASWWGATGVRFGSGGDVQAYWAPGKAAGTTSVTGRMRIDPQFAGMPIAPALWAHEIGHALGLAHNTFGIMRPSVGANFRPTSAEINTVRQLYGGQVQMGEGAHGGSSGSGLRQGGWGNVNRSSIHYSSSGGHGVQRGATFSSQGGSVSRSNVGSGNAEMLRNSQRGANANEDAARTLRRVERILSSLPQGIREGVNHNMKHGLETGRSMNASDINRMERRLSGGAPIARKR